MVNLTILRKIEPFHCEMWVDTCLLQLELPINFGDDTPDG